MTPTPCTSRLTEWAGEQGLTLYPHQDEALIELLGGSNVVLATPTGSGKSLVATGAHLAALADGRVSFYTAPIKALVSEKFFALCEVFGADDVGMLTGDASVNADAPIIACTAEVLANIALREGARADVGLVVMDEFHYYGEPDRGWAWQVPLLELPDAQFVLMSATLGDVSEIAADLSRRTGRATAVVDEAERPVPLSFRWSVEPLDETVEELVTTGQAPAYVVHFTQANAVEHATRLLGVGGLAGIDRQHKDAIAEKIGAFRFGAGFGKTLQKLVKAGIGVHHAGMLPKYRRLVETLAQAGLLTVICGTDTLGVGINVPIRTVLFTGLAKFDGNRQRVLKTREFLQIAGRAGRAGFDTAGFVVVQAPEHVIENEKAKAKSDAKNKVNPKKKSKPQLKKPPEGTVVWSEQTFDKLVAGEPEKLASRMRVDNAMLVNVLSRPEDAFVVLRRLLTENHEPRRQQLRLARRALRLTRSLVRSGTVTRLDEPDEHGRRYVLTVDLPEDFALNQPLAHFALAAFDVLDPEAETYALDVVSVVEAVLEAPRQVLMAQQHAARGVAVGEMKADGIEYEERMALLDQITWPQPLAGAARGDVRDVPPDPPVAARGRPRPEVGAPRDVGAGDGVHRLRPPLRAGPFRGAGAALPQRRLPDAAADRARRAPLARPRDDHRVAGGDDPPDRLLAHRRVGGAQPPRRGARPIATSRAPPPRPLSAQERVLTAMVRNAMFARVAACARDDLDALMRLERAAADRFEPPRDVVMTRSRWDEALEDYYREHETLATDGDARGPAYFWMGAEEIGEPPGAQEGTTARLRQVRQTLADPADHRDWVIEAVVDLDATDAAGELVLVATACRSLTGVAVHEPVHQAGP